MKKEKISKNTNWVITLVAVIAIVFILCYIVGLLPSSLTNIDMTTEKLYTLTDTTKKVLGELDQKVTIYALYDRLTGEQDVASMGKAEIVRILDLYDESPSVDVQYVDLDRNPAFLKNKVGDSLASSYTNEDYIVECGDNVRKVENDSLYASEVIEEYYTYVSGLQAERKFTSAILKVIETPPVIYYSTDFGEQDIRYYSKITDFIENSGYDLKPIELKTQDIPEDATSLVFFGPTGDITDEVLNKVDRWLKKGYSAFFFMDIKNFRDGKIIYDDFKYFNTLFANYGIALEKTIVEGDDETTIKSGDVSVIKASTSIAGSLEKLSSSMEFYAMNSRSLILDNMGQYSEAEAIVKTTSGAKSISVDNENESRNGQAVLAASGKCTAGTKTSRICVFGSSHSFLDAMAQMFGSTTTQTVLSTSMEWMDMGVNENIGDTIEVKKYNSIMTSRVEATENQVKTIAIISIFVVPGIILIIGIIVFIRRRHL